MGDELEIELLAELAEVAKMLAHPQRLQMLLAVSSGELSVEHLAEVTGLSFATTSQHLQQLRRSGLLDSRREGKRVFYRAGEGPGLEAIEALRRYCAHREKVKGEVLSLGQARPDLLHGINRDELLALMREGSVILLDVRPVKEFGEGHLNGALNIPIEELVTRLDELDRQREIVAFCRGPFCVLSEKAARLLKERGFRARRFGGGPDTSVKGED